MSRSPRIEYYGAIYHIIQQGNKEYSIFENESDKMKFLNILGDVKELYDFYLVAYCIMDNYYHLVIKTHNNPISKVMHRTNILYAKYYNLRYKSTGSPFKGRYKSIIVDNEHNLLNLINYIHNNPVYKNIVKTMTEYKWSSDVFFRMNIESIVDIDYALNILSENRELAIKKYTDLMNIYNNDFKETKQEFETIHAPLKVRRIKLEDILRQLCQRETDYDLIRSGSKKFYLMEIKRRFIEEGLSEGFTYSEIGKFISIGERAVRKYVKVKGEELKC